MIFTWRYGYGYYSLRGDRTDPKPRTYAIVSTYDFLAFIRPLLINNPENSHSIMVKYKSLSEATTEIDELAMLYYPGSTIKDRP